MDQPMSDQGPLKGRQHNYEHKHKHEQKDKIKCQNTDKKFKK